MLIKKYENEILDEEIKLFYDDLAKKYLKNDDYTYGREEYGEILKNEIGRYLLSTDNIKIIDPLLNLSFLLHTEEGHIKQDELVINYHKNVLIKELKELMIIYLNEDFDISNIAYTDGAKIIAKEEIEKNLKDEKYKMSNLIKVTPAGILIAAHIFGVRKVKKLFNKEKNYVKNGLPVSYFIDSKEYDISFLTGKLKDEKVVPRVKEKDKKDIDIGDKFVGQNNKGILEQLKKLAKNNDLIKMLLEQIKSKNKKEIPEHVENFLKERSKNPNDKNTNSYMAKTNENLIKKLNEKFEKEYENKKYDEYFEDTTNSKIEDEDRKAFNEVLRAKEKFEPKSIIEQKDFDRYRDIVRKKLNLFEYIYDECMKAQDPLVKLENLLSFFTCKYEDDNKMSTARKLTVKFFASKLKNYFINKINDKTGFNIPKENFDVIGSNPLMDIDDIRFHIRDLSLSEHVKTKEYKFLQMFKNEDLVKRSFELNKNGKRVYKRARRYLDNLQLELIIKIVRLNKKEIDGHSNRNTNIVSNYISFLDELLNGLSYDNYKWFTKVKKEFNITNLVISLLKTDVSYKEESLMYISELMYDKSYDKYTNNQNFSNDKNEIKKIFRTKDSIEYNMRLRNSYNISSFYLCFYEDKSNENSDNFVCHDAKLNCTLSPDISTLIVTNSKQMIENKPVATIYDNNIVPFKTCSVNKACIAKLGTWQKKGNILVGNSPALLSGSTCNCSLGGIVSIVSSGQSKTNIQKIEQRKSNRIFKVDDYKSIDILYEFTKNNYFSSFSFMIYSSITNVYNLDKYYVLKIKRLLKPKIDEKNLCADKVIPVVDTSISSIINVYNMGKILKGYYLGKLTNRRSKDRYINIGIDLSQIKDFRKFFNKAKKQLDVIYTPYKMQKNNEDNPYWMKKVFEEYNKHYKGDSLKMAVRKYHKYGGGINADISIPWCASFVNYILDTGLKSPSSQCFYTSRGKMYFNKIDNAKYGAILVLRNKDKITGHCTFILSENENGYYCIGGNQANRIKKSYYIKNEKVYGIFWPK